MDVTMAITNSNVLWDSRTRSLRSRLNGRRRRGGFSFTEVLFAVMVLGIGFIMIAAMFPVVISQTQSTLAETNGALEGRAALAFLASVATEETFRPTLTKADFEKDRSLGARPPVSVLPNDVATSSGTFAVRGNFVSSANPRYGWVPIYRRGRDADGRPWPYAQVMMIPVQARGRTEFHTTRVNTSLSDVESPDAAGTTPPNLGLRPVKVTLTRQGPDEPAHMKVTSGYAVAAVTGAYVVITDGKKETAPGRVYQLGEQLPNGDWVLSASADMREPAANEDDDISSAVDAYIVGRSFPNPDTGETEITGNAQDIGIYVGFVRVPSNPKSAGE